MSMVGTGLADFDAGAREAIRAVQALCQRKTSAPFEVIASGPFEPLSTLDAAVSEAIATAARTGLYTDVVDTDSGEPVYTAVPTLCEVP